MKPERLHEYIVPAVATLAGMIFAIKMGSLTGHGSMGVLSLFLLGVFCVTLCIWLRTKTWILIALTWDLTGVVPITNLPLGVRDMVVGIVVCSYGVFYALKMIRVKTRPDWVDFLAALMVIYMLTVYIRNPVGINALGSERVGGRPYFDVGISLLAFGVLSRAPADIVSLRRLPLFLLTGTGMLLLGSLCIYIFPASVNILSELYSGFIPADEAAQAGDVTSRKGGLGMGSNTALRVLCSYYVPITLANPLYFWRFAATVFCFIGVLLSGFRSSLIAVMMYGVVSSYFRRRLSDVIKLGLVAFILVGVLGVANGRLFTLPLAMQRALTIFPGNWDYVAAADAQNSTQWRLDMWKMVLSEDRYIKDRLLGDGYGFTRAELGIMQSEMSGRGGFIGAARQESFMVSGMFHSGPLSTIRYVGYIGLMIYTTLIVYLAVRGWRLVRASEGTKLFAPALFVAMPTIIHPLIFYFLAGQFQYNLPDTIFAAGLLKLVERGVENLKEPKAAFTRTPEVIRQRPSSRARPAIPSYVRP